MSGKIITTTFVEPFLDNLFKYIDEYYLKKEKGLERLALVFGGKRPRLFVQRELARRFKKGFVPPRFFTVDEFMATVVRKKDNFSSGQDLNNCYLLYQLAREHCPAILEGRETFAMFLPWTREILRFIDQLDLEKVPDERLRSIEENAAIGYSVPEDINRLLEHVVVLRGAYHKKMRASGEYSRGLQYLRASEVVEDVDFDEFDEILFCNFFYFNRSEEAVVRHLHKQGKATLIFQGDERKWPVLKHIAKRFEHPILEGDEPLPPPFKLNLYSAFDGHSQVATVREILKTIPDPEKAVIVLPDPNHIIPLVSEISQVAKEFNISMGYPLKRSSLYSLFQFIFQAQLSQKSGRYYAKDYLRVLRHPFVKNLALGSDETVTRILVHKIEEVLTGKQQEPLSGTLFFKLDDVLECDAIHDSCLPMLNAMGHSMERKDVKKILAGIHEQVFQQWEGIGCFHAFAQVLGNVLELLVEKSSMAHFPLNMNIAREMYAIKDELSGLSFGHEAFEKEDLFRIFDSKISREIVAFHGSPLKGLQVLGLFETRSLNFEHVVIMDVNEGILPRLNIYEPLIPREVMISLNLDRMELEEEIQRYQFMRVISSAKHVHLVYQEGRDKEKSRFVEELIWGEEKKRKQMKCVPVTRVGFAAKVVSGTRQAKKTPEMIELLRRHKYSASSVNTYLRDPYEFYQKYVLGLKEQDDLLDEPEARHVGTFIHELLEESFKGFLNKAPVIDAGFRERFTRTFEQKFSQVFGKSMRSDAFLFRSILEERMRRFLDKEEQERSRHIKEILFLEHKFEGVLPLSCGEIRFGAVIDRIDRMADGSLQVLDYKTGAIDQMPKKFQSLQSMEFSRENIFENIRSFQLPLYFYYLHTHFPEDNVNAALYNLRTLEVKPFLDADLLAERQAVCDFYLRALDFVISEILSLDIDFVEGKATR